MINNNNMVKENQMNAPQNAQPNNLDSLLCELKERGIVHERIFKDNPSVNDALNRGLNVWQFCYEFVSDISKLKEREQYLCEITNTYKLKGVDAVKEMLT